MALDTDEHFCGFMLIIVQVDLHMPAACLPDFIFLVNQVKMEARYDKLSDKSQ